ncbi:MAG: hypothetical protein ACI88A_004344 [Paraglaciecola sp.]|jgi:hypothetical protein
MAGLKTISFGFYLFTLVNVGGALAQTTDAAKLASWVA